MIDFRTLGAPGLEETGGPDGLPIVIQAKRLALLAYLALAGRGRPRRRDSIVGLFWPELDDQRARSALRQALSYLRRTLGASALETRGHEEVAIAPDQVHCDAVLFDEAVAEGRLEDALTLYRGDFLAGLFVSDGSPELDEWIDSERARLRRSAAACAWSLAEASRERGDGAAALAWARRGSGLVPDDEARLRWLITLHDSCGDRAGAIGAYEQFARRLAAEYGAEPAAETVALMNAVRARSAASPPGFPALTPAPTRVTSASVAPTTRTRSSYRRLLDRSALLLAAAPALVLLVALGSFVYRRAAPPAPITVAVLPVDDLGSDGTQQQLTDALTEQLITELAGVRDLQVINRRTMLSFRGSSRRPHDVARELGADEVVTSSMTRTGDRVRLSVQLVRDRDERISWAWSGNVLVGDLLRVAELVADSVAGHVLRSRRTAGPVPLRSSRRTDPAAFDLYIQGRYWWNKRGSGLLRSIDLFNAALDRDPTFALAYSGIGDAYVQLGYGSLLRPDDAFPKARAAAERALLLDSTLAEPHATLGFVRLYYDWDWPRAEREFQKALMLNASSATAHEWYGLFLAAMGRFDEALGHERRAQALDPLATAVAATAAWVLYYAGRHTEAERELRVALRMDSSFALGRFYLGRVLEARGMLDSALAEYSAAGQLREWVPTIAAVGHLQATRGRLVEARTSLARLDSLSSQQYVTAYGVALVHAALGQRDSAFAWLERGVAERTHWLVWLRRDPRWAVLRSDPRFESLATRLKLPQ